MHLKLDVNEGEFKLLNNDEIEKLTNKVKVSC